MTMKIKTIGVLCLLAVMIAACSKEGNDAKNSEPVMYVQAEGGLRMRDSADTNANVILTIPNSSQVTVLETKEPQFEISGKSGKWTKVKYQDKEGWVFGGFLSERNPLDRPPSVLTTEELFRSFTSYRLTKDMGIISNVECCPNPFGCKSCSIKEVEFHEDFVNIIVDAVTLSDSETAEPWAQTIHCYVGRNLLVKHYGNSKLITEQFTDERCIVCATEGLREFPPDYSKLSACQ